MTLATITGKLATYWTWKVKLGVAIGGIVLGGMMLRWYGNHAYNQGREAEKQTVSKKAQEQANQKRDAEIKTITAERDATAKHARESLDAASQQFNAASQKIDARIRTQEAEERNARVLVDSKLREDNARVIQTPAGNRPDIIRALNSELRPGRGAVNSGGTPGDGAEPR